MNLQAPLKTIRSTHGTTPKNLQEFLDWRSQGFGENPALYAPLGLIGHNGIDWSCDVGTPVYASHDGVVEQVLSDPTSSVGEGITVKADGYKTLYWHFSKTQVTQGQQVSKGQQIGLSGNTGFSTGPHLHFGLKLLDSNGNVLNRNNGYDGAVDPISYLVWWDQNAQETMSAKEVNGLYVLAFYREPNQEEVNFWVGKTLSEFLATAIKDRASFLTSYE